MNDKIILGTAQMGLPYGINNNIGKISIEMSFAILDYAHTSGIKFLDSADAYGDAHQVIGQYHKQAKHKTFDVITKIPHSISGAIEDKVNNYLRELNIKSLWGLMFHSFASYKCKPHILHQLVQLQNKSFIKYLGVSVYTKDEFSQVVDDKHINLIQFPFNLLDNYSMRGELMRRAKERGKILHTRSAFLQGLFFMNRNTDFFLLHKLKNELEELDKVVSDQGTSIGDLALNYCLSQPEIDNVLIGVDTLEQLKNNLASAGIKLEAEVIAKINQIQVKNQDLLNPTLWK
jgi:aryl-alcohol dehydrogenase-like predicted oxidoreductase